MENGGDDFWGTTQKILGIIFLIIAIVIGIRNLFGYSNVPMRFEMPTVDKQIEDNSKPNASNDWSTEKSTQNVPYDWSSDNQTPDIRDLRTRQKECMERLVKSGRAKSCKNINDDVVCFTSQDVADARTCKSG